MYRQYRFGTIRYNYNSVSQPPVDIIVFNTVSYITFSYEEVLHVRREVTGMATTKVQEDNLGVAFIALIKDENDAVVDLSTATSMKFIFEKPDGTILEGTGVYVTDGTDGKMKYLTQSGDLDVVGSWKYQTLITFTNKALYSTISKFKVIGNLPT